MSRSDRYFDLTLRILMLAVFVTLLGCVTWLMHRWSAPAPDEGALVSVVEAPEPIVPRTMPQRSPIEPVAQLLHAPGHIFKCERNGRISYSDQPCRATETELSAH